MPIEFLCPHCQHLLRTPDDKAGMSAKCPACGEMIWVPYAHQSGSSSPESDASGSEADAENLSPDEEADAEEISPQAPIPVPEQFDQTSSGQADEPPGQQTSSGEERDRGLLICQQCGAENDADQTECAFCGAPLRKPHQRRRAEKTQARSESPNINELFSDTWSLYIDNLVVLLFGPLLLLLAILPAFALIFPLICCVGAPFAEDAAPGIGILVFASTMMIFFVLASLIGAVYTVGVNRLMLKAALGKEISIGDAFYGFSGGTRFLLRAWALTLIGIVFAIVTLGIGGIFIWPLGLILLHRDLSVSDTITVYWNLLKQNFGIILLLSIIGLGINLLGGAVPMGQLFTAPFTQLFWAFGYLRLVER